MKEATPLNFFEKICFRIYVTGNVAKNPFEYRITDPLARSYMRIYLKAIEEGVPSSHPLISERWKTFGEFKSEVTGEENIPKDRSFIAAMNHYKRGRLRGNWTGAAVFDAISNIIDTDEKRRYRMVITDKKFHKIFRRIMFNTASVNDGINTNSVRTIFEALRDNQIVGIFPTGKDELGLHRLEPMAGKLFKMLGRKNYPVMPVGAWFDKENKIYRINFGIPEIFGKTDEFFDDQTIADCIGMKIANLLPLSLRGYYRDLNPQFLS